MTDSRKDQPHGLNFGGVKSRRIETILDRLRRENAKRVKCPHCVLMIMPATLAHHIEVCHEE